MIPYKAAVAAIKQIAKQYGKKDRAVVLDKLQKKFKGEDLYGWSLDKSVPAGKRWKLKRHISTALKDQKVSPYTSEQLADLTGVRDKLGQRILTEATKKSISERYYKNLEEARGWSLSKIKSYYGEQNPIYKKIYKDRRDPKLISSLPLDKQLVSGVEGPVKTALPSIIKQDVPLLKGIASLFRSDLGWKGPYMSRQAQSDAYRELLGNPKNIKNYIKTAEKFRPQLEKTGNEMSYWLSKAEGGKDFSKLRELIEDYALMQKSRNPKYWYSRAMTWGHPSGIGANIENFRKRGVDLSKVLGRDPKYLTKMDPEIGPLNVRKDPIDRNIMSFVSDPKFPLDPYGLDEMSKLYEMAGIRSIMPSRTGKRMYLGQWDPYTQMDFLKRAVDLGKKPFEGLNKKQIRDILRGYKNLDDFGFAAGGIANLGAKILPKLAKKLSDKELKLVMETLWKGVDPKQSARYRAWAKNRWGPGYKWPYKKSKVKGPEIKKSHMANLSSSERVELQSKYADQLWEYQMKKKLKMPMDEDLSYPFLSPDNKAFITTGPRTGLGRYQLRSMVDPEATSPISKYSVYDWWDDILQQMRKKPKFKYVKDDKGNVIMKKVK
jgi:predicted DCC family thiol-disulfide oxidoreductase YuxK